MDRNLRLMENLAVGSSPSFINPLEEDPYSTRIHQRNVFCMNIIPGFESIPFCKCKDDLCKQQVSNIIKTIEAERNCVEAIKELTKYLEKARNDHCFISCTLEVGDKDRQVIIEQAERMLAHRKNQLVNLTLQIYNDCGQRNFFHS